MDSSGIILDDAELHHIAFHGGASFSSRLSFLHPFVLPRSFHFYDFAKPLPHRIVIFRPSGKGLIKYLGEKRDSVAL
jgi:hypothetical protein